MPKKVGFLFPLVYIIIFDSFRLFSTFFALLFFTKGVLPAQKLSFLPGFSAENASGNTFRKNPLFFKKGIDFIEITRYNVKLYDIMHKEV